MILEKAKELMFLQWKRTLGYIRSHNKCKDYGYGSSIDQLWDRLPKISQEYWLRRATLP